MFVDADDRSVIAAADAGDIADLDQLRCVGILQLQRLFESPGAVEVAAHVVADADVDADGGLETEVRVEAGDGVDVFDADAAAGGDAFDLPDGDEADLVLNMAQVFEDAQFIAAWLDAYQDFRHGAHRTYAPSISAERKRCAGLAGQFSRRLVASLVTS